MLKQEKCSVILMKYKINTKCNVISDQSLVLVDYYKTNDKTKNHIAFLNDILCLFATLTRISYYCTFGFQWNLNEIVEMVLGRRIVLLKSPL